jgi:iron-sulfur cluster assembly protein
MNRLLSRIDPISVTDRAWIRMSEIIRNTDYIGFLFSIDGGGCNGFNYSMELSKENQFKNASVIEKNSTKIIIEPSSEMYLLGTTIDYKKEDYSKGLFENKFVFIPDSKLAYSCGCGKSFTVK